MERAPLPPHERSWRHPSELGPTLHDVDQSTSGRGLALASGAVAAVVVAVMVVTLTPRRSPAPLAVGATTIPPANIELQVSADVDDRFDPTTVDAAASVPTARRDEVVALSTALDSRGPLRQPLALTAIPNAVSAAPLERADDIDMAQGLPHDDEPVLVLTPSHTYRVAWGDVGLLGAPDGAIVITEDGGLVASFFDGALTVLAGP